MIKDQEYLKSKASYCLDLAKKLGATDASVTIGNSISETVSFRNKVLEESNRSDSLAISIETYIDKKKSSISSSNLLDENLKVLIEKCFETTKITPEDEFNSLPDKELLAKNIKDLNLYDQSHIENDKKIDYLKELEDAASDNKKIINTESSFTQDAVNDEDLYPLQKPSLFANIKFDLFSVKPDSVFIIFLSIEAVSSSSFK